jgi:hypothetical protein
MRFDSPEILYAAPAAVGLVALVAVLGRRSFPSRGRAIAAAALRSLILVLLLAALAGPHLPWTTESGRPTGLLADGSGSISPAGRDEIEERATALDDEGPWRRASFGDGSSSDPRAALLEEAVAPSDRLLVATDGHLDADPSPLLADLSAAGRSAGILPIEAERGESRRPPPAAPVVRVPARVRGGEAFGIEVSAPGATSATLVLDGGRRQEATVRDGVARFEGIVVGPGRHEALVVARGDGGTAVRRPCCSSARRRTARSPGRSRPRASSSARTRRTWPTCVWSC